MSKLPKDHHDDWSSDSKDLFRAVRSDHAPSAVDRERVRRALAQRVANTPELPVSATLTRTGSTLTRLTKLGVGLTLAAASTFAVQRFSDARELQARPSVTQTSASEPPSAASPAAPSADTAAAQTAVVARVPADTESTRTGRPAQSESARRAKARGASAPARGSGGRAPAKSESASELSHVEESTQVGRGGNTNSAAMQQSAANRSAAVTEFAQAHTPEATRETRGESPLAAARRQTEQPEARSASATAQDHADQPAPLSAATVVAPQEPVSDPRAELSFIHKIQAALVTGDAASVLDLCSEHARRWPHGTFVQEREGLRALALCESAARDASAHARQFLKQYPRTPLRARVREACKLKF